MARGGQSEQSKEGLEIAVATTDPIALYEVLGRGWN